MPAPAHRDRPWDDWVREAATVRPVVLAGSGVDHLSWLAAAGATVAGAVGVGTGFDPPVPERTAYLDRVIPVLGLGSPVRSALDLQAWGFSAALRSAAAEVRHFLDAVDPGGDAAVVSLYATPSEVACGRPNWAVDAALAEQLEAKTVGAAALGGTLDWIDGEPAPAAVDDGWWRATTARLGTDRLVVQALGMNCGGRATWICDAAEAVTEAIGSCPGGARLSPFVEGVPVNVMAAVEDGAVLVMPPSVVTGTTDAQGRPGYAGNMTGHLAPDVAESVAGDARRAGQQLASQGYRGPFGLDAVITADGRRRYHDLNARVNGSARLHDVHVPLFPALLLLPGWLTPERCVDAERELWAASARRPMARTWLRETACSGAPLRNVRPGRYRVDPDGSAAWLDDVDEPESVSGDIVAVRTRAVDHLRVRAGDDVVHGDLFADPALHVALVERAGDGLVDRLLDLLRGSRA